MVPPDIRHAWRTLRRNKLSGGVTIFTLALGIGVVTALFAIVDAVLLDPIATNQERLVRIWKLDVARGSLRAQIAYFEFAAWRDQARSFASLAAIQYADAGRAAITVDGQPAAVSFTPVSSNFFATLHHAPPLLGRWLQRIDDQPGAELVAVVSEGFWRRVTGADPAIIGRLFTFNGDRTVRVVGVAPARLDYPIGTDLWVPIPAFFDGKNGRFDANARRTWLFELIGRLADGVSAEQAQAELAVLHRQLAAQFPQDYGVMEIVAQPLVHAMVGGSRQVLWFLFAGAGLVFLIAGVNVAALLLMQTAERRSELAMRIALGANSARLTQQTVTESLLLGGLGSIGAVFVAQSLLRLAQWLATGEVPRIEHASLDTRVLGFAVFAAVVWVLALGTVPIWGYRRFERSGMFARATTAVHASRGLKIFTLAEVAAAVTIAIGAGLLVRSFVHLQRVDRGFNDQNLAVMSLLLPASHYPDARTRVALYNELLPRLEAIPGVVAASPVHLRPGSGFVGLSAPMRFEGQTPEDARTNPWATWEPTMPSYFKTLGIQIVRGRGISETDIADSAPVAVVSEAVAEQYWPGQDPIGKQLKFIADFPWTTVVGVARDMRYRELTKSWLTVYFPARQFFFFAPDSVVVRAESSPTALLPAIRQTIRSVAPAVAVDEVTTMDVLTAKELSGPRTAVAVSTLFALFAIVLAAVGVSAVVAYDVRQRRRELAVRAALGASGRRLVKEVAGRSLAIGTIGLLTGAAMAAAGSRTLGALLYELDPMDPATFAGGTMALLVIVIAASYIPARRAAMTDPATVLRE
jgi:predicted permease